MTQSNGTTYTSANFEANGNTWQVIKAEGKINHITIVKLTNNPFRGMGKDYQDFDHAIWSYKSKAVRAELLKMKEGKTIFA